MEDPNDPLVHEAPRTALDDCVRENPTGAILAALGIGLAAGLLVHLLRPQPQPRSRVKQLLEEIRERLHDLTDPAMEHLGELADDGSDALKKSIACAGNAASSRLRSLSSKAAGMFR
ncbi:MAG TPA: DUF883 C-terminal domain-containing protein [Chthoniobacteraceae bacterium]|nr:DUF883 C-terminal domain-containing protein [Chthoniobacteraceae bacterium]